VTPEDEAYVRYRLERARGALDEAKMLIDAGHLHTAVNRLYYACFYCVSALLLTEGKRVAKHRGVLSLFDRDWVKGRRVPVELGRVYHRLFDRRLEADYKDMAVFDPGKVKQWLEEAESFVSDLAKLLEESLKKAPAGNEDQGAP
jgi:uncharacterized protein (UPF0332 family)